MKSEEYEVMFRVENRHWWYVGLRSIIFEFWDRYMDAADPRVLDVGCGTGALVHALDSRAHVMGVDYEPLAIGFCRKRGITRCAVASALALPFGAEQFDAVMSLDVLCHRSIPDNDVPLQEFHRVLKPGGSLLMNLPAYAWLYSSHDVAVHTDHRFTRREVNRLLRRNSFELLRSTYWNTFLFPAIALVRLWRKLSHPQSSDLDYGSGEAVGGILGAVLALERRILRFTALPFGLSIFTVAQKR